MKQQELVQEHAQQTLKRTRASLPSAWQTAAEKVGTSEIFNWSGENERLEKDRTDERAVNCIRPGSIATYCGKTKMIWRRKRRRSPRSTEGTGGPGGRARGGPVERQDLRRSVRPGATGACAAGNLPQAAEEIAEETLQAEGNLAVQRTLAELLGRDRLQLYLVRQAERQVVEHANAVLDRLSRGQLYLKLSGEAEGDGASGKALELEAYNRETGERPINVAFLSGSQKFRVAVSLALGIGQYASRQHRPIESVIIDEGFGCLDRHGRQVMIQELQNLRNQMRCILLVSHQEEFADAFSDGYHFELEGGATRVKRFQK